MSRVYLDQNVYGQLEDEASWRAIRQALDEAHHRVIVGDAIIGEAIRISDPTSRRNLVHCITGLRSEWTDGVPGESMVTEAYRAIQRLHPNWIVSDRRRRLLRQLRANRKAVLTGIRTNYEQQDLWNRNLGPMLQAQAEAIRVWQKSAVAALQKSTYRDVMTERLPSDVRLPDELSDAELQWRLLAAERFYSVTNGLSAEPADFLGDLRHGLSVSDWANFWLTVRLEEVPATAIHGLVRYFQLFRSLKGGGNMIDAMHATASLGCDFLVTSDRNLYLTMLDVRDAMRGVSPNPRYLPTGTITPTSLNAVLA